MKKRKAGRPKLPTGQARGSIITFRLREKEAILIRKAAKAKGVKVSSWMRDALNKAVR